jgi:hypothetical protein
VTSEPSTLWIPSPNVVYGAVEPRLWTPPLRDLEDEESSWGYDFIDFCAHIGWPLYPWQQWLAIHLGELFPDGTPRYRKALILVARQNGKTLFTRLLILYWMFVERVPQIVATNADRGEAMRSWRKVIKMAEHTPLLAGALPVRHTAGTTGNEDFWNAYDSHYRFSAPTRRAGRGDTVHRALLDELREHKNRDTWDAIVPAQNAVSDGLLVCISNEGDMESVVLHEEYDAAETFILTGEGDHRVFLGAWSAPSGTAPDDVEALRQANPGLGHCIDIQTLLGEAKTRMSAGGETLQRFRIEYLCQRVDLLEAAIRLEDWQACGVPRDRGIDMGPHRRHVALCFDVASDNSHATLAAAVTLDGITHIEIVASWDGYECRRQLRAELPGWLKLIKPRKCVWFPGGPAAAVADEWSGRRVSGVLMEPIRAEDVVRACMGLEEQATARHLQHTHDPLAELHVRQSQRIPQGDGWRFARQGKAPIDATYAMGGAVHAARVLPRLGPVV